MADRKNIAPDELIKYIGKMITVELTNEKEVQEGLESAWYFPIMKGILIDYLNSTNLKDKAIIFNHKGKDLTIKFTKIKFISVE
jgi:hypothetical protein